MASQGSEDVVRSLTRALDETPVNWEGVVHAAEGVLEQRGKKGFAVVYTAVLDALVRAESDITQTVDLAESLFKVR